ncbi:MAG: DsbA family protein [Candidatus Colwellbacteria bacterium]|nr:DsbA family protein [Candidatus Colwellbacteria bacterium]
MNKDNNFLAISILVAALIIAGTLIYVLGPKGGGSAGAPSGEDVPVVAQAPDVGDDYVLGDSKAPVTIIEFGDYQCPFCGRFFSQTEPQIIENYVKTGKAKFVYKDLIIIDGFVAGGQESTNAAMAANCAGEQGKFWEYHNLLFETEIKDGQENNGNLNRNLFLGMARSLGLNEGQFTGCFDSKKYLAEVEGDTKEAQASLSQLSTPSTFVNNRFVSGALPYAQFASIIEEELKK